MVICHTERNRTIDTVRQYYTKVVDQCFSDDERRFVTLNSSGRLTTFLTPHNAAHISNSVSWTVDSSVPLCIASSSNCLLCGCRDGFVRVFSWNHSTNDREKPLAVETLKVSGSEISAILPLSDGASAHNITGCSDGSLQLYDIEQKKTIISFDGHSDQVNKTVARGRRSANSTYQCSEFVTCSNDGHVKLWDTRLGRAPVKMLRVRNSRQVRPNFSRAVFALDIDDDFIVCGGGVSLGMWHLSSESLITTLEEPNHPHPMVYLSSEMSGGRIFAGGRGLISDGSRLLSFDYTGSHVLSIPLRGIYSIQSISSMAAAPRKGDKLTLVSGSSAEIFCLNEAGFLLQTINIESNQCNEFNNTNPAHL